MDPLYINQSGLSTETKLELVNSAEEEIKDMLANLEQVSKLAPTLDSEYIKSITNWLLIYWSFKWFFFIAEVPDLNPQLEKLTLSYLEFKGKTDQQTGEVQELYKKYNKIVSFQKKCNIYWNGNKCLKFSLTSYRWIWFLPPSWSGTSWSLIVRSMRHQRRSLIEADPKWVSAFFLLEELLSPLQFSN